MLRTKAARVLDGVGAFSAFRKIRSFGLDPWITVLTYHRVGDPERIGELDGGVVDAREAAFDAQMAFLQKHFSVIGLDELAHFARGGTLPVNPVLVTFDDGYRDNHDVALPILKRHHIPAVFFLATHYLNERRLFWWDRASLLIRRCTKDALDLSYPRARRIPLGQEPKARARAFRAALAPVKAYFGIELGRYMEDLERATGVTLSRDEERRLADQHLLTWEHVKAMADAGMSIQSHTKTHRILGTLDPAALDDELGGSREELSAKLGRPVTAVAYPVGKSLACAPEARRAIRRAGSELGFSNGTGLTTTLRFDPMEVKRLSLEVDLPDAYFRGMVSLPFFAYEPHADPRRTDYPH